MAPKPSFLRRHARRLVALAAVLATYGMARLPSLPDHERRELASRFVFERRVLPTVGKVPERTLRPVHPDLEHISAWISSVGASVALHDLDGDGLPNDACWIDTRSDKVVVTPVPGTPSRYPPFSLSAQGLGYDPATMAPMGCLPGDFNEDGRSDLLVYYWGRTPVAFVRMASSELPGSNGYHAVALVPGGERWYTNAATLADVDGDGHSDLIMGNYFPDDARVLDARGGGREEMQHSMSRAFNGGRNRILLWAGIRAGGRLEVRFRDAPDALGSEVAHGWTLAIGAADLDGDLLPEIYFANDFGPDRLLHNRSAPGRPAFVLLEGTRTPGTPSSKVLGRDSFKGMGVDFGDLNGDGLLDLFVSNIASEYSLEESHFAWISTGHPERMRGGLAPYEDRSEALGLSRSGWGWEARLADLDNNGVLEALQATGFIRGETNRWPELQELAMGNDELLRHPSSWPRFQPGDDVSGKQHNPLFVRAADGRYYDLAPEIGLSEPWVSRGIATADVDADGRLDFALANQWDRSFVFLNRAPRPGSFLGLALVFRPLGEGGPTEVRRGLPEPGARLRPAIGAAATVRLAGNEVRVAQVDGGNGHSGKRSPQLHFGLGDHPPDRALKVEVRWRNANGEVRRENFRLLAGWHTIILGHGGER